MVLVVILSIFLLLIGLAVIFASRGDIISPPRIAGLMIILGGLVLLGTMAIVTIPAGQVGVVYDPFAGGVQEYQLKEGFHFILPWQEVTQYSLRTMTYNMHEGGDDVSIFGLTNEGLEVMVDLSVVYHVQSNKAWELHKTVGEYYTDVLVKPITRTKVRDLIAFYKAEDLYTTDKRVALQASITKKIQDELEPRGIIIESILIRDIVLPTTIKGAIETKLKAEQDAKAMEFVLQKEQKEAERKVVEANGIAQSNKIIAASLSTNYLTWYWIQSLKDQNNVIYVPIGQNGLPMFKDIDNVLVNTSQ